MTYDGFSLDGRVALVTGAARGIGRALSLGLAQAGAHVAVLDLPHMAEEAQGVRKDIEALGRTCRTYTLDVRDIPSVQPAVDRIAADFGALDILINNAGTRIQKPALEVTEDEWDLVVDTNLKGLFFCAQAAARHMVPRGSGRIINLASQLGLVATPGRPAYCASKGGVINLTRALALEWIRHGVTVNAIGPGPTDTGRGAPEPDLAEAQRVIEARMPLGRRMQPEELVGAAIYLASPAAAAITGHTMIVDGGYVAQ